MRRRILFMCTFSAVLLVMSLLAGCGGFMKGDTSMKTFDFRKGTSGVSMQFMENAPPVSVFVGSEFSIALKLKNLGAANIESGMLEIEIPDESAFRFPETPTKYFSLSGKSMYASEGEEVNVFFPVKALCFPGFTGGRESILRNYTKNIKAMACYGYETDANADICVDTKIYSRQIAEGASCRMQAVSFSGGQGGPVEVVSMSPQIIPLGENKVKFQLAIAVKKADDSVRIFNPSGGCKDLDFENRIPVSVEMGKVQMKCEPSEIKLQKGGVSFNCWRDDIAADAGVFASPVNVKLSYVVYQGMMKGIRVEAPPSGAVVDCEALKK